MFRVAHWPDWSRVNPYLRLFYEAMSPYGVASVGEAVVNIAWLRDCRGKLDAIHLHWPEHYWKRRRRGAVRQLRYLVRFWNYLVRARKLGLKIIWTIHNSEPHERTSWIDAIGRRMLAHAADLVICHSREAAAAVEPLCRRGAEVVVMPHGNYAGVFPAPRERDAVLAELGLSPDLPVFSCVGHIRDYKGFDLAAGAATAFRGRAQFVIAGAPHWTCDITLLRRAAEELDNLHMFERVLSEQEFADVVGVSHAVILPYRKITGSGALLAAWTLGKPAIAADLPYFREAAEPEPLAVQFFRPDDAADLGRAIEECLATDEVPQRRAAAALSQHYSWSACIEPVIQVLRTWSLRRD